MAVTNQDSAQLANMAAEPRVMNPTTDTHGRVRFARFSFVQSGAGDAGSFARLVSLPKGRVRVILPLSRVAFSAMGAGRTLDIGWESYRADDGSGAVAAESNGLDDGVDVASAGAVVPAGTVGSDETMLFASLTGAVLSAQVNGGTIPDATTLSGHIAYVMD